MVNMHGPHHCVHHHVHAKPQHPMRTTISEHHAYTCYTQETSAWVGGSICTACKACQGCPITQQQPATCTTTRTRTTGTIAVCNEHVFMCMCMCMYCMCLGVHVYVYNIRRTFPTQQYQIPPCPAHPYIPYPSTQTFPTQHTGCSSNVPGSS